MQAGRPAGREAGRQAGSKVLQQWLVVAWQMLRCVSGRGMQSAAASAHAVWMNRLLVGVGVSLVVERCVCLCFRCVCVCGSCRLCQPQV
jgi:hypothetical protein